MNVFSLFLILISFRVNASTEKAALERYYETLYVGEKPTVNYSGNLDPRAIFNEQTGKQKLLDDEFKERYLTSQFQSEIFNLHNFWFDKVSNESLCPDSELGENIDYIRYLYRLVSISYLYESLILSNQSVISLNLNSKMCKIDYNEIFGKCKPITSDMKKFQERAGGKIINDVQKRQIDKLSKKEIESWFAKLHKTTSLTSDPTYSRIYNWCKKSGKNCRNLSSEDVQSALNSFCKFDKEMISLSCSEKDSLYGISYVDNMTELIKKSNAFNLINKNGMGEDCLHRFVKTYSSKEVFYDELISEFGVIHSHLLNTNSRYAQGELFLPGALKEFDMKGLSDFLVALKPPKAAPIFVAKPKPKVVVKPKPEVIIAKIEPVPTPVKMDIPELPKAPKVSEIERAFAELEEKKLESLSINMEAFRDDFEFTQDKISELSQNMKKFQTRTALKDMKDYDHLGTKEAPVGLIFLKFLIVTENHQSLFNVVTILGDHFYIYNDIENKESPHLIELRNNESTRNLWQIIVLRNK